ncbi:MAG TPA: hypothetical protein VE568_17490 [Rubrobacter sp.]|jgi:hypothetical protein|nr:hypothetical protein [Rubrobacter sp.]
MKRPDPLQLPAQRPPEPPATHYLEGRGGPFDGIFGGSDNDAEEVGGGGEAGY